MTRSKPVFAGKVGHSFPAAEFRAGKRQLPLPYQLWLVSR